VAEDRFLLKDATLFDAIGLRRVDIRLEKGVVSEMGVGLLPGVGEEMINCDGLLVAPSFIDLHTHLREPGGEEAETFLSGSIAAAAGGYCRVVAMPNTEPVPDSLGVIDEIRGRTLRLPIAIDLAASITKGRKGGEIVEITELTRRGVKVFTDDGNGVQSAMLMRRAFEASAASGAILAQHCEDESIMSGGAMNEGEIGERLGLKMISSLAETIMVARDVELCKAIGGRLHLQHISTSRAVALVSEAKGDGAFVTCEVTPHHLLLDESYVGSGNSLFKVNPPLRTIDDVDGLWRGVASGAVDVIGTDHAPHPRWKKDLPFESAAFGMVGIEESLSASFLGARRFMGRNPGYLPKLSVGTIDVEELGPPQISVEEFVWLLKLVELLSLGPRRLLRLPNDPIAEGMKADLVVIDPSVNRVISNESIWSKSKNSPYLGMELPLAIRHNIVNGRMIVRDRCVEVERYWR
jgi:dihydroorotase